jgi:hypothetical protein
VQTGAKNIEIAVMENGVLEELEPAEIERISAIIERENLAQVFITNLGGEKEAC